MQGETRFKLKVYKRLDTLKPLVWYTKLQQVAKRGDPDLLICCNGKFVAWELKVESNKATVLQQFMLDKIMDSGGMARVVKPSNLDACVEELKILCQHPS